MKEIHEDMNKSFLKPDLFNNLSSNSKERMEEKRCLIINKLQISRKPS